MHTQTTQQLGRARADITRRQLFAWVSWGSFVAFWGSIALATMRFFFPRVLYEPSPQFQAGKPEDYQIGEVSTRFMQAQRVWMTRTSEGIYALIAICTHLGCTPVWYDDEARFKCPCHGSNFLLDGTNIAGPAPVPLYRAAIALDLMGNLVVDKSRQANQPGVRDRPPFFLALPRTGSPAA
jgi:cytochrome b6-f complex iron-sulfur subunit